MQEKQQLIKMFYTACSRNNADGKKLLLQKYNLTSASDATPMQLKKLTEYIGNNAHAWRRRVFGAIGAKLRNEKRESNAVIIKAIACRAAKTEDFNKISVEKLRALYNQFSSIINNEN